MTKSTAPSGQKISAANHEGVRYCGQNFTKRHPVKAMSEFSKNTQTASIRWRLCWLAQGFESNAISVAIAFFIAEKTFFGLPLHCPLPKILFSHCRCIARFLGNAI